MKIISTLLFLILLTTLQAQNDKVLNTKISGVKVFLAGAQITRTGDVYLPAGISDVVIQNLPTDINERTIQVTGKGEVTVLSVAYRTNYLTNLPRPNAIKILEDSLDLLRRQIDYQNAMSAVYSSEEAMILANKSIGGTNSGVDINSLKANADFYRIRLSDIKTKQLEIGQKLKNFNTEIQRVQNQLNELNAKRNQPSGEIVIKVNVKAPNSASFVVQYNVNNAGWIPMYDLRATDISSPVKLSFKAGIYQTTGEEWKNVKLSLSTANPNQSGDKPILNPWFLYYYQAETQNYKYSNKPSVATKDRAKAESAVDKEQYDDFKSSNQYTTVTEYPINFEYGIDLPYTIEMDGSMQIVEVKEYQLTAMYQYYTVPKLDADAFLMARVTGWEQYNLMAGEANVFFEGTYVGKSYINPLTALDTLDVSLGRDKSISVRRNLMKDYSGERFIGTQQKVTKSWEIIVKNNKSKDIEIVINDQFPISNNKEIEVDRIEYSGASLEDATGKLTWTIKLKPGESKTLKLKYSVKYPKGQQMMLY